MKNPGRIKAHSNHAKRLRQLAKNDCKTSLLVEYSTAKQFDHKGPSLNFRQCILTKRCIRYIYQQFKRASKQPRNSFEILRAL